MRTVGLIINADKPLAISAGAAIIAWLEAKAIRPMLDAPGAATVDRPELAVASPSSWGEAELLIVLGGDGTLIRAAAMVAPMQVPILGINTGHLGFLTEIENADLFEHLEPLLEGQYIIEERLMLTARVERAGQQLLELTALNDAVISKGTRSRVVHLGVSVGEHDVARYPADGVIVATPSGSTAYSLSAGGPIVSPTVDVLLITPICPHTMNSRTMVVAGSEQVSITIEESPGEVGLSADGSDPITLYRGDVVRVSRAPYNARLLRRPAYSFYDVLRQKLSTPER